MEHGMLWVEYAEWMEFYALEPWGTQIEDDRFAKLINYLVAINSTEDHKWIATTKIFPRTEADIVPDEPEPELDVGVRLRAMFQARNERLVASAGQSPPTP